MQMVYSGIFLIMINISYCTIEIVIFDLFFQENVMDCHRFFVKWHVAWDRMVTHAKLQYYKQNYCLVCMTGLLGCRWHRYKQSTRDSRKVIEFNISYSTWKWNVTQKIQSNLPKRPHAINDHFYSPDDLYHILTGFNDHLHNVTNDRQKENAFPNDHFNFFNDH